MAFSPSNKANLFGAFVPTTYLFDIDYVLSVLNPDNDEERELQILLYEAINNIILTTNLKDTGYYLTTEFVPGSSFFTLTNSSAQTRPVYRTVVNFGALPATGTKSVAHGIVGIGTTYSFTRIYGCATNPNTKFIPLPYVSATAITNNLELNADTTNVNITTGGTSYSSYTTTYVILEYLKN